MGGESLSSDSFKYKFGYNQRDRTVAKFFFNDFCSTPSCARKIRPFPTFELLTPSPTAVSAYSITSTLDTGAIVTEEISDKDILVTDNAIGDHSIDEGVSVSSPKDGQLIVADAGATGSIPKALEDFGESLPIVTPLNVRRPLEDGSYSSIDRSARMPNIAIPKYIRQNTPEKVKEYINLVEEEIDVDDSHLESLISDIEKSIESFSITDEDIKKEFGEEVGKNVTEDVGSTKMERVSFHKEEEEIADHKNDDSFACETEVSKKGKAESSETIDSYNDLPVANCHIIVSRTLQLQRNKYLAELSDQECVLADFLFYSEYNDVPMLSIDEHNPAVIQKNEELRHTLESSVLLDIINPANPNIHNYINWLIDERKKKEKIDSIIAEKEIDLEKAKDNPCYDTMKAEWLKDKQKMIYRDSTFFADKCRQSMSEWEKIFMFCKVFLQGNQIKHRGFDGLHHRNRRTIPFSWRSNQNDFDCGVYCIKAMEWYDGWNEKKHPITTLLT
ncbi:3-isopropylmalate dehydrogenase, partial [Bienertia sinuspersici]